MQFPFLHLTRKYIVNSSALASLNKFILNVPVWGNVHMLLITSVGVIMEQLCSFGGK